MVQMLSEVESLHRRADSKTAVTQEPARSDGLAAQEGRAPVRNEPRPECQAALALPDGTACMTSLICISLSNLRIEGAPPCWQVDQSVVFTLGIGVTMVPLAGRVDWREGDTVKIHFTDRSPEHGLKIQWLLCEVLAAWKKMAFGL